MERTVLFVERFNKEKDFKGIFKKYLNDMQLFNVTEPRYTDFYKINSFPFQGVELHKTVMSYHFALNSLIRETNNIHRLPFMLDAILKEDIDDRNFLSYCRLLEEIFRQIRNHLYRCLSILKTTS